MNPDNLATPMASAIGDILALSVLAFISSSLFSIVCESTVNGHSDKIFISNFTFHSSPHLGALRHDWCSVFDVTFLVYSVFLQSIHTNGFNIGMDPTIISLTHQWVGVA
jgi:hypothetical protein